MAADTSAATEGREIELLRVNDMAEVSSGQGRSKLVSPNWELPWSADLRRILVHSGGLVPALETLLRHDPRIQAAYIFGSWARRYHGESGHFPHDTGVRILDTRFDGLIAGPKSLNDLQVSPYSSIAAPLINGVFEAGGAELTCRDVEPSRSLGEHRAKYQSVNHLKAAGKQALSEIGLKFTVDEDSNIIGTECAVCGGPILAGDQAEGHAIIRHENCPGPEVRVQLGILQPL